MLGTKGVLPSKLYIPHGSDESEATLEERKEFFMLYIPHGSDERRTLPVRAFR